MSDDKDKKFYELAFLLENEGNYADTLRLCRQHNVEVKNESRPKKIHLAYKIGKRTQADFGFLRLLGLPDDVKSLEHDLRTANGVLRALIVRLPKDAIAAREPAMPKRKRGPAPERRAAPAPAQRPRAEVLSNEALERKIEEILQ